MHQLQSDRATLVGSGGFACRPSAGDAVMFQKYFPSTDEDSFDTGVCKELYSARINLVHPLRLQ